MSSPIDHEQRGDREGEDYIIINTNGGLYHIWSFSGYTIFGISFVTNSCLVQFKELFKRMGNFLTQVYKW